MTEAGPHGKPYPRFSDAEMANRRAALEDVLHARDLEHAVVYGANRFGSAVGWLTRWPVTREALVVFTPGTADALFVNFYNHVPNARVIASEAEVRWAGSAIESALGELSARAGRGARVGVIGPLGFAYHRRLAEFAADVVDLNGDYTQLRLIKSPEELEWVRVGAGLTDAAVGALQSEARPGMTEAELGNIVERAYVGRGGTTHVHYFGVTSMDDPVVGVPAQWPSTRTVRTGDVLTAEISAAYWDHPGQLLRTFMVGRPPTGLFGDLHAAAEAAFDAIVERLRAGATAADVVDASAAIEESGFTTRDDLIHGFVGGYLPPILGSSSRTLEPVPEFTFRAGMTVVVQPNVVTADESAGVQTGELLLITDEGAERLHHFQRGLLAIDHA
jgi:Xaa-Pro dipeptidase